MDEQLAYYYLYLTFTIFQFNGIILGLAKGRCEMKLPGLVKIL